MTRRRRLRMPGPVAMIAVLTATAVLAMSPPASATNARHGTSWALDRLDQFLRQPEDHLFRWHSETDGTGVTVFVLSTGVFTGEDLGGRVGPALAFGGAKNADPNLESCAGTDGTTLASLAGGTDNGVAKDATFRFLQLNGCSSVLACPPPPGQCNQTSSQDPVTTADVVEAVDWVTANAPGRTVALLDYAVAGSSAPLDQAVTDSVAAGVTWVVRAGDNTSQAACELAPSSLGPTDGVITVGATDPNDAYVAGTGWGSCVDIFAPGLDVDTLYPVGGATQVAAAFTAGVIAQYLEPGQVTTPAQAEYMVTSQGSGGAVTGAPTNAPNVLLHSAWWGPVIYVMCENISLSPPAVIECVTGDLNGASSGHRWSRDGQALSAANGQNPMQVGCRIGSFHTFRARTSRYGHTDTRELSSFVCDLAP